MPYPFLAEEPTVTSLLPG